MVSDASHELRTPLAVLQAQLELLRTGDRARLDTDLLEAERAAVRLNQLVDSLLELSRLDSGRAPTRATVGELVEEAGEALDRARLSVAGDQVEIDLTVPEPAAPDGRVSMAPLLYGRVIDNLLTNSLRALGGEGRIAVTLSVEAGHFVTTVVDTGPGMSPEFIPQAFDRFSQEDRSRTAGHGSGLGLAIVAAAAAAAGGTAQLVNAATHGLMITVALPILDSRGRPTGGHLPLQ